MDPATDKYNNMIRFLIREKWFTITVLGSIFTFQFATGIKNFLIDPILDFLLPDDKFSFMDLVIREGVPVEPKNPRLTFRLGDFFREFIKYLFLIFLLFLLSKYTNFPDTPGGNTIGSALM